MESGESSYRRFLDGDDNGLAEIITGYKDGLMLYISSLVNDIYTAEELTEETFFRLMIKKPTFSGRSSFKSWLYAIGRHVSVDYLRKNSKIADGTLEKSGGHIADESDVERSYIREERKITVYKALGKLPRDYRQVIWLSYFEELSNSETALVMRKTPRQIRNLLYRAKQSLKSELIKEGFTYEEF